MKKAALLAAIGLGLAVPSAQAFTWPWQHDETAETMSSPRPVVTETLEMHQLVERAVPGVIAARVEVVLAFQTLGRLVDRPVDIGTVVKKGELLAALDPDDLQDNVTVATAGVEAADVQLRTTRANAERTRELARRNVATAAQLEAAEAALTAATAAKEQAKSELLRARDAEGFAELRAPFDGVISDVYENTGAVVSAGGNIVQLSADNQLEAVIDLPELALASVALDEPFEVWSETDPDHLRKATVRVIEPLADAATRTRRVRLSLEDHRDLRIGTLVRARPLGTEGDVLTLPRTAILKDGDISKVWIVNRGDDKKTGTVSLREITTRDPVIAGRVIVTSGLSAGDQVVTRGIHSLTEGQSVGRSVSP